MLHRPFSIHICFPLGTVKPCFVPERITRAERLTVCFSVSRKILSLRATIVIQIFYILSKNSGQQSTLLESFSKQFGIHYFFVVEDSERLIMIQFSTTPWNSMQMTCVPCRLFIRFKSLRWTKRKSL